MMLTDELQACWERAEKAEKQLARWKSLRIIRGNWGNGWAYVFGSEYPTEGPGDGTRFATPQAAIDHAMREK